MWQMSDFEAAAFILAVALTVALFTIVTWDWDSFVTGQSRKPLSHRKAVPLSQLNGDPRQHFRVVSLGDQQQRFHRDLPLGRIMLGLRGDVFRRPRKVRNSRPSGWTMGSTNRLNQAISRTGIIVSDVKRKQGYERK
jgi:hypothetical protein